MRFVRFRMRLCWNTRQLPPEIAGCGSASHKRTPDAAESVPDAAEVTPDAEAKTISQEREQ